MATRDERRPVAFFTNDNDTAHLTEAVAAGVSAYVMAGLSEDRFCPIFSVAMASFQHGQGLSKKAACEKFRKAAVYIFLWLGEVAQRMPDMADLLS